MNDLRITLIQSDIYWEDPAENLESFGRILSNLQEKTDLIVLPEMFNTGFSLNPLKCAETMEGKTLSFLKERSGELDCMIMGSILIAENGSYFNRLVTIYPDGSVHQYDKRHLFRLSEEFKTISSGKTKTIIQWKNWKILPLVCYDLRFPVWSKNRSIGKEYEYDLLIYVANWPGSRAGIWKSLLIARAIENQCYVIGVNRIGKDGQGTSHSGDSMVVGPDGEIVISAPGETPAVLSKTLSLEKLQNYRAGYPFATDWDQFFIYP